MSGEKRTDPFNILRGVVFLLAGLSLAAGTLYSAHGSQAFGHRALLAQGRVIRLNAGGSHPEIRFTTQRGQTIEYPQGGMIAGYSVGQRVQVLYDPANPNDAVLNTFGARWGFTIAFFVMSLVFIGGGVALLCVELQAVRDVSRPGS